jgi:hypothetical protein
MNQIYEIATAPSGPRDDTLGLRNTVFFDFFLQTFFVNSEQDGGGGPVPGGLIQRL